VSIDTQALSDRLSPRREVGVAAIALSIAAHVCVGVALAALWVPPELLSSVRRREVVPTDVDVLDEPGSSESIADVAEKDEDLAQGPRGAKESDEKPAPAATQPAPTPTAPAPAPPPAAEATAAAPPRPMPSARPPAQTSPADGGAPSAAASTGSGPTGEPDAGGGAKRPELPSVMARFTHDLAEWGSGVPAWQTAPIGDAGSIIVTIAVGDEGKLDKLHDPFGGEASQLSPVLVESVKRTKAALVTKMGSRNVLVKFKVGAVVSDVPPPEGDALSLSFDSYDAKTKKGGSTFTLGSGRRVTFSVEVLETRALTDSP
jgi:hypothetical protein